MCARHQYIAKLLSGAADRGRQQAPNHLTADWFATRCQWAYSAVQALRVCMMSNEVRLLAHNLLEAMQIAGRLMSCHRQQWTVLEVCAH